ncbi:MAG: ribonucleoside-diphosphate reductase [Mesorhizobium sp.]|nr:MAG: ribonucleoside-diphosphate reductase [Mesorhizobium sp.]RWB13586.1 MAG: ribonucleoside-diphosphate reductase [Mesorhizobium sp.]
MSRDYEPGMGKAVADRTINRPGERWSDVAHRVALGNSLLDQKVNDYPALSHHLLQASTLMSGRHLQHGDVNQPGRPMEVFSNCSTAMLRFLNFKLLLSGSGVGGSYDDDLMVVDWTKQPNVVPVLDPSHPDVVSGRVKGFLSLRDAMHLYEGRDIVVYRVPDSREGWAKAIEQIEKMAYQGLTDHILILDFSDVRAFGLPIKGMQNRPASGPGPLMDAIVNVARIRGTDMAPWKAAMFADHFQAECVLVGGARRAARIATKFWRDKSIFDFINIKRPLEFRGKTREEVEALRATDLFQSHLWSSNNSVAVDKEFWDALACNPWMSQADRVHARKVWNAVMDAQYGDGTGEPGFLNVHKLTMNDADIEQYREQAFAGSKLYTPDEVTLQLMRELTERVLAHSYHYIVNPCGEIVLFMLGAFCVIADVVPFHATSDADAEDAFRVVTRALIRVNTMDSIYNLEVARTNRIGVGLTGLHEWMWTRFNLGFREAVALPMTKKASEFWDMLKRFGDAVDDEAESYAKLLGVTVPHTNKTAKPAGTTSKLFGLTEGVHLPALRKYLRWVQFRTDDPLVAEYAAKGYPIRQLETYAGTTVVGFPTAPVITTLGMGDLLVTAAEATPAEQFRWLRLLEKYWLGEKYGNQISYTLKYDPTVVSFSEFEKVMRVNVPTVRAVSVLPQINSLSYEYTPEEEISDKRFAEIVAGIEAMAEDVDRVHVDCDNGACPIDFAK